MKKYLLLILTLMSIIIPCSVHAVDITVGAVAWYMRWDTEWAEFDLGSPGFLYGPALSVKFSDDYNLTFVFLYGKFTGQDSDTQTVYGDVSPYNPKDINMDFNYKVKRYDSDIALNYRLNDYLKVFCFLKYLAYQYKAPMYNKNSYEFDEIDVDRISYGPGLGLTGNYRIVDNLFGIATLSGFYLWCVDDYNYGKLKYESYGFNSTLSVQTA
jgi:hypothetical protein